MALLADAGRTVPVEAPEQDAEREPDHLADIGEVLGGESKVRTQTVLRRLAELNPDAYGEWSFRDLAAALAEEEIRPVKIRGTMFVRAADVTDALTERDNEDEQ
jgi:S-DNA-T family DNA segregation ATPase FtsK/SpoIIIE